MVNVREGLSAVSWFGWRGSAVLTAGSTRFEARAIYCTLPTFM